MQFMPHERRSMEYLEFVETMRDWVEDALPDQKVTIREVLKNNGIRLQGLTITDQICAASPTIYLERFYESYLEKVGIDEIGEKILEVYEENRIKEEISLDFINDYELVRENLYFKAVNRGQNRDLLSEVPYKEFLDLALVPYILIGATPMGSATAVVRRNMLNLWGVTEESLLRDTNLNMVRNAKYSLTRIEDIISDMLPKESERIKRSDETQMYVLLNPGKSFAAALMSMEHVMEKIAEDLNADLIVLPSSVHEVIILPAHGMTDLSKLDEMVKSVNESTVSREEVLSDHAYFYERGTGYTANTI